MAERLEGASWEQLGAQLAWIAAAQLGLLILSALLNPAIALLEASEVWMTFKLKWYGLSYPRLLYPPLCMYCIMQIFRRD